MAETQIINQLKQLGLHTSEIAVYLSLLEQGIASPPEIARRTGIARTNCYHILNRLMAQQLIVEEFKGKRKLYAARDPHALLSILERKREIVEALVPDLRALSVAQKNKPSIRFYQGIDEVRELYMETLSAPEIHAIGSTKTLSDIDPDFYADYLKRAAKNKIIFYDIQTLPSREKGVPQIQEALGGLYAVKFLPATAKDVTTDMLFWGDNIASITLEPPVFGTLIASPSLARTYRVIFDVLWQQL